MQKFDIMTEELEWLDLSTMKVMMKLLDNSRFWIVESILEMGATIKQEDLIYFSGAKWVLEQLITDIAKMYVLKRDAKKAEIFGEEDINN